MPFFKHRQALLYTLLLMTLAPVLSELTTEKKCVNLNVASLPKDFPSFFIIEAKGRLGNHLIAFTLVQALAKVLNVQPLLTSETRDFLSRYFDFEFTVPIVEEAFCNWDQLNFLPFEGTLQELLDDKALHQGHLLDLWPRGYGLNAKKCCPAQDLQMFVQEHIGSEARQALTFIPKFSDYAQNLRQKAANRTGMKIEDITFVGIHNRRTDYIPYMESKFGVSNPFKKRYFYDAMDYFREEHDDQTVFFYVSDDMDWGRKNIRNKHKDLFFVGNGNTEDPDSIGYDLAVLAACNHTITTWGSFSMWATFLCGGEYYSEYGVIVPKQIQEPDKSERKKLKELEKRRKLAKEQETEPKTEL